MDWRLAGLAQSVIMEFVVDGQPTIPDASSTYFTAWNHLGVQIESYPFVPAVNDPPTQMKVVMSAALNNIASDSLFETRYLRADFLYQGLPYFITVAYNLHHMVPLTVTPKVVRALVGADEDELPDEDIGVMAAYFRLMESYSLVLPVALRRTDAVSLNANKAIALQAALTLCPSFQSRLLKSEKADNAGYQRADMDFLKLEGDLRSSLLIALQEIVASLGGSVEAFEPHTVFVVTKQTDRITNSAT